MKSSALPARAGLRAAAVALISLVYLLVSHWLMTRTHESPWNAVGVFAPTLAIVAVGAWRAGQRALGAAAAMLVAALCAQALSGLTFSAQRLYLAQHVGINLLLAAGFGGTLRTGHTALVTQLAARVHRVFTPAMAVYTRKVTLAWTLYFIGMALLSLLLYEFASFDTWAIFANLLTPVAVVLMFGAEYTLRYRLHPEFERSSVADAVRAYLHGKKTSSAPRPRDPLA